MIAVSYATNDAYAAEAQRLIRSCATHGVSLRFDRQPDLGSWQANTQHKADYLLRLRRELRGPLLWLDADAEVCKPPTLFGDLPADTDVAVHYRDGHELLSGTLWIGDTQRALGLLESWVSINASRPMTWDQRNLDGAIRLACGNLNVYQLPPTYCQIFDTMAGAGDPVILHHQASRRLKVA